MTMTRDSSEHFRKLQKQYLDLVQALTRANGKLLKARQHAGGTEFEVMTAERNHAAGAQNDLSDASLDKAYAQELAAKQTLSAAEDQIADLERQLSKITREMTQSEGSRE